MFIVSDLGLTAFTGGDGIHAFVRSLSEATAIMGTQVKLVARNKITVLDMTGIPGEVRHRGTIGTCSLAPSLFELSKPGFPPIIAAATLADYLDCEL